MASELKIFSLYQVQHTDNYYLLQTERPSYSNASQTQEDLAYQIEKNKRKYILEYLEQNNEAKNGTTLIGELQDYPIGEALYTDNGNVELDIYYIETEFGWPWIILGTANSETEFLAELNDDGDLVRLNPIGQVKKIKALFLTENDIDLSEVEHFDTKDLR